MTGLNVSGMQPSWITYPDRGLVRELTSRLSITAVTVGPGGLERCDD